MEKYTLVIISLNSINKEQNYNKQGILVFHTKPLEEGRVSEEEKYNI